MKFTIAKALEAPKGVAKIISGGKTITSKSPKATGIAGKFSMGKTRGGQPIHSYSHKDKNSGWSSHDHMDAMWAHSKHVKELGQTDSPNPHLLQHHLDAMKFHHAAANHEGSVKKAHHKKSKVVGRTSSGKPIHRHNHAAHPDHKGWSKQDHGEASSLHGKRAIKAIESAIHMLKSKNKSALGLVRVLTSLQHDHTHHARGHHHIANPTEKNGGN